MSRVADLDVQKIASKNPRVDVEKIHQLDRIVTKLRAAGFVGRGYELASPFQRPVPKGASASAKSRPRRRR